MISVAACSKRALVVVFAVTVGSASAKTKSWAALEGSLPADTTRVASIDVAAARGAASFPKLLALATDKDRGAKRMIDLVKQACSIDVVASISDVSIAINDKFEGVVAIGLDGVDETKAFDCFGKLAKQISPKLKVTSKPGKVTEYVMEEGSEKDSVFAAWPAKDVVVIALKPDKRAALDGYTAGKAASGDLAAWIGKASTAASLAWGVGKTTDPDVKGIYGSVTLAKGTLAGAVKVIATDATVAGKLVTDAKRAVKNVVDTVGAKSPDLAKVLTAIKIGAVGAELVFEATVQEADLPTLIAGLDKLL